MAFGNFKYGFTGGDYNKSEYQKGFDNGAAEAWRLVDKIWNMGCKETFEAFGYNFTKHIVELMSYEEAKVKLEEYERKQKEPKVGDVYEFCGGKGVITNRVGDECYITWEDGSSNTYSVKNIMLPPYTATGKNIKSKLDCVLSELEV